MGIVKENELTKTSKEQDVNYKRSEANALDKSLGELTGDLETTRGELTAAQHAADSLREQCVKKPETYEERRAKREAEINGLKEALEILATQAALLQQSSPRPH
eukprot:NODE_7107_length_461_cov_44.866995.p2 GENE.NODE_7107_length_461_cov_44.866995~~NODE_7107_length_461_cov_44.866995.p2  ORF type:complete len:104 (+),score=53.06 NODE_7107_length_461_cov_44.866995:3-314(+)